MFSILMIIDGIRLVKFCSIGYLHKGDFFRYTVMLYNLLKALIRVNFIYVLVHNSDKITKVNKGIESMTDSLKDYLNNNYSISNKVRPLELRI